MTDISTAVRAFHTAMGVPILDRPTVPADERVRLRARLVAEEFLECLEAMFDAGPSSTDYIDARRLKEARDAIAAMIDEADVRVDLPSLADGLCDLAYVIEGTNLEFGIDSEKVLDEVHRCNMAKTNGPVREDGKRLKPPGWTPPDIPAVLERQGWKK